MRRKMSKPFWAAIITVLVVGNAWAAFGLVGAALSPTEARLYASPTGRGGGCSYESPCSLTEARDRVRSINENMRGDIVVYLRGGTYVLSSPLKLTSQDSGSGGYQVIYRAYENEKPIISGGTRISGWTLHDGQKNVYKARVGTSLRTRQLYVDGVRATRARGEADPFGFVKTSAGYTTTDTAIEHWANVDDIEFVDFVQWLNYRCGVSSVSGTTITMQEPCWSNTQREYKPKDWRMGSPEWIENAYEVLDEPGEWYLDNSTGWLYYKPRPGEDISTATVIAPRLETLVEGTGTLDEPIHDVQFYGITFSYATWLAPDTDQGYAAGQAGFRYVSHGGVSKQEKPQANVRFTAAKSIRFERNVFAHMGGVGLAFAHGSQDNTLIGNKFYDLSGGSIYLGDIDNHHPSDSRAVVKDNVIKNNYITKVGAEYFDHPGIWVGYTDGSLIEHNELHDLPYSGISVGWGWGCVDPPGDCDWTKSYTTPTVARDNKVRYNHIHDYTKVLVDGGGVYTLGAQPGSEISNNYIHHQENLYAPVYLDEGTEYFTVENNVLASVPEWIRIWTGSIKNNVIQHNYTDNPSLTNNGTDNVVSDNAVVEDGNWPEEARSIMSNAGIEASYKDVK
jgi:hypothetical protein